MWKITELFQYMLELLSIINSWCITELARSRKPLYIIGIELLHSMWTNSWSFMRYATTIMLSKYLSSFSFSAWKMVSVGIVLNAPPSKIVEVIFLIFELLDFAPHLNNTMATALSLCHVVVCSHEGGFDNHKAAVLISIIFILVTLDMLLFC